jgi:hypothetical protein
VEKVMAELTLEMAEQAVKAGQQSVLERFHLYTISDLSP